MKPQVVSVAHHIARRSLEPENPQTMTKKIIAIVFIFICTSVAWAILGATLFSRTYDSGAVSANQVESLWGTSQNQAPPTASYKTTNTVQQASVENGVQVIRRINE